DLVRRSFEVEDLLHRDRQRTGVELAPVDSRVALGPRAVQDRQAVALDLGHDVDLLVRPYVLATVLDHALPVADRAPLREQPAAASFSATPASSEKATSRTTLSVVRSNWYATNIGQLIVTFSPDVVAALTEASSVTARTSSTACIVASSTAKPASPAHSSCT